MDIPSLMTSFATSNNKSILDSILKNVTIKTKDAKKDLLSVFLVLDLDKEKIRFYTEPYSKDKSCKEYNYFGNNSASQTQFYIVRDCDSLINYWSGSKVGIFKCLLNSLPDGVLKELLTEAADKGLFSDEGINTDKILYKTHGNFSVYYKKDGKDKSLYLKVPKQEDIKCNSEKFLQLCLDMGGNNKPIIIIPEIYKNGESITISTHPDYTNLVEEFLKGKGNGDTGVCHICGKNRNDINTLEYSTKFSRNGIGKVFVTTTVNYAPLFKKQDYTKNYSICGDCYNKLMFGEKEVLEKYRIRIAKEDAILLFEGIDKKLDKSEMDSFTRKIDMVFNPDKFKSEIERLEFSLSEDESDLYEFHIIFYKSNGKSCEIKKTIESVSNIRFNYVNEVFEDVREKYFQEELIYFKIGHIYRMIPVNVAKDGTQLNIYRVLNLYGAIIKNELVEKKYIFELALEALEKGHNELRSSELRNYKNLYFLEKAYENQKINGDSYGIDRFIKYIIFYYISFLHVVTDLKIIDKEVFFMQNSRKIDENLPEQIQEMEQFLNKQQFTDEACGLFYLGTLLYQVGVAQAKQSHKQKPILDKIQYTGMSRNDVLDLYSNLWEKRSQYQSQINLYIWEYLEKQAHIYLGNPEKSLLFSEKENVFYIMSGYAFCVGRYKKNDKENEQNNDEKVEV